jgi:hypothetical protein
MAHSTAANPSYCVLTKIKVLSSHQSLSFFGGNWVGNSRLFSHATGMGHRGSHIVTLAAMAALAALTADAAARQARPAPTTEATAPREAGEPIMAIVSIGSQQVTFYDADGWILRAPVSTGTTGRETPAGVFAIIEKQKDHHSRLSMTMPGCRTCSQIGKLSASLAEDLQIVAAHRSRPRRSLRIRGIAALESSGARSCLSR